MEFHKTISKRRTVREFKPDQVPRESVRRALAAGLRAPCNAHLKSWRFILMRDREKRSRAVNQGLKARDIKDKGEIERFIAPFADEELKSVYRRSLPVQLTMMLEAPELLVVSYKMKPLAECRGLFELNPLASVWMCIENIMLALAAEGLYGCTYTPYDARGLKEFLEVPAGYEIAAVIPFGFPAKEPDEGIPENLDERLSLDGWRNPAVF
ncbi:MAG: nitroreductase family protein [Candidatus Aminicenantales bacterium]